MRTLLLRGALGTIAAVGIGCFGDLNTQTDPDPPVLRITSPQANDTVGGLVIIQAAAEDAFGVASVRFYIDGGLLFTDYVAPYQAVWNANGLSGKHVIKVEARDESGNTTTESIQVTVDNSRS
jgi:hypothetical protein